MDDKESRFMKLSHSRSESFRRHHKPTTHHRQPLWRTIYTHKHIVFTCCLFGLIIALLFGILTQLPTPNTNAVPTGETEAAYTTLLTQVDKGNVQAAVFEGNTVHVLLAQPLSTPAPSISKPGNTTTASPNPTQWVQDRKTTTSEFNSASSAGKERTLFVRIPEGINSSFAQTLTEHHIVFATMQPQAHSWLSALLKWLPLFLAIAFFVFFMLRRNPLSPRSIGDRMQHLGKSKARRIEHLKASTTATGEKDEATSSVTRRDEGSAALSSSMGVSTTVARVANVPQVTFEDVAGIDEVRSELQEIVGFLRDPERFNRLGARIPRGALLSGPPGTGKTLLAKAVAGEADVPFFSMSASEFVEMFVGIGASRVRDLFSQARKAAPCVVFIDEIDAVGRKRSARAMGSDERDQTLNQLLVELDGFDARQAVVVLAATNRVDILDSALLRPGRFDRRISVSAPDRVGREAILKVHTRKVPLHDDVDLTTLARTTPGMTGADLANLVNEAALSAARRDLESVTPHCFEEALARVQLGALRPLVMSEEEKRVIAVHESGHALVAHHLPEADTVNCVTILPRGQSLGVTQFTSENDRYNYSRETLMTRIAVALGGRVAEELVFGPERVTTGAENDLQVVTGLAHRMVTRWGMSERVGVIFTDTSSEMGYSAAFQSVDRDAIPSQSRTLVAHPDGSLHLNGPLPQQRVLKMALPTPAPSRPSSSFNGLIDSEVQRIIQDGYKMARAILTEHPAQLTQLTDALIEHEQLDRAQFEALLQD